jgi:hypothetical protein
MFFAGMVSGPESEATSAVRLTQEGLEHIVSRHWATSGVNNVSLFSPETTARFLRSLINEAVENGAQRANTFGRPGTIFEHSFDNAIGTNSGGNLTNQLRVVISPNGTVKTAFPY